DDRVPAVAAQRAIDALLMNGNGVVDAGLDPAIRQVTLELVAPIDRDDEQVVHVLRVWMFGGRLETRLGETLAVHARDSPARRIPAVEMAKLHLQDRGVNSVEPAVRSLDVVVVFPVLAVVPGLGEV